MDRKYIDDHHIAARYLADQLSDADREAFETYYVEHPDVLRDLEAAARMKVGLAQLREAGELDALMTARTWRPNRRFLAAAAVAALAVGVGLFVFRSPAMQPVLAASSSRLTDWRGAPLPLASTHLVLRTRSASYDADIELPEASQTVELRVLPEYEAQPARYRLALHAIAADDSLQPLAQVAGLTPDAEGFVPIFVNTARIEAGRYQLTLAADEGASGAGEESSFVIRIRPAGEAPQQY